MNKARRKALHKAKKTFPAHKELIVRIKDDAVNPFDSSIFEAFLKNREQPTNRKKYHLYIHLRDKYMRFSTSSPDVFEDIRLPIDSLLWIELLHIFTLVKIVKNDEDEIEAIYRRVKPHLY